jgi:DNA-binding MarR family transcriptional regulator
MAVDSKMSSAVTDCRMPTDATSLLTLLNEIHWVSAELKKRAAGSPEEQRVLLATRGLLQTLADRGQQTVPAIAEARNTSRQNIQIIANRLADLGCVEFVTNPHHKKSDLLRLTPKGQALLTSNAAEETRTITDLSPHLRKTEVDAAVACLGHLRSLLNSGSPVTRATVSRSEVKELPERASAVSSRIPIPAIAVPDALLSETTQVHIYEESLPVNLL